MLSVESLDAFYGKKQILFKVGFEVKAREITTLIGPNGAGKSTVLKAVFGLVRSRQGQLLFDGHDISKTASSRNVDLGIALVPQGGRVFRDLTVADNLLMGGYTLASRALVGERRDKVLETFPRLRERYSQKASSLSGGERQALSFGMAMMLEPKLLMIDEPSIGLAPKLVTQMFDSILMVRERLGSAVLIVEQQAQQVLRVADNVLVIRGGVVIGSGPADQYRDSETLRRVYLSEAEEEEANVNQA